LIESNKALVTDISVLSSSERIEKIAVEELGMRKATSDEIVRVSIKGK
jgi:cell division protein FtsL